EGGARGVDKMRARKKGGESTANECERNVVAARLALYTIGKWILDHMREIAAELQVLVIAIRPQSLGPLGGNFLVKFRYIGPRHPVPFLGNSETILLYSMATATGEVPIAVIELLTD